MSPLATWKAIKASSQAMSRMIKSAINMKPPRRHLADDYSKCILRTSQYSRASANRNIYSNLRYHTHGACLRCRCRSAYFDPNTIKIGGPTRSQRAGEQAPGGFRKGEA